MTLLAPASSYVEDEYEFTLTLYDNVEPKRTTTTEVRITFRYTSSNTTTTIIEIIFSAVVLFGLLAIILIVIVVSRVACRLQRDLAAKRKLRLVLDKPFNYIIFKSCFAMAPTASI